MTSQPGSARGVDRQLAEIAAVLRGPWVPPDVGGPRVLTGSAYDEARRFIHKGGWTGVDVATLHAVHRGARPGDPLPPRQPDYCLNHITSAEVIVTGSGQDQRVAVLFSHQHFPGVRFGHRFVLDPSGGRRAAFALMEDIETGELHRMMEVPPSPDKAGITWTRWGARVPGFDGQHAEIQTAFTEGWRPAGEGRPRALTEPAYTEARRLLGHGGWTGLDHATIEAVRGGAQPGDPLPPPQAKPYIDNVTDTEVIITGTGQGRRMAVLFSHTSFPGVRFGHRFPLDYSCGGDPIDLKEEIETGALHRMMQSQPGPDHNGIIWTTWGSPAQQPE